MSVPRHLQSAPLRDAEHDRFILLFFERYLTGEDPYRNVPKANTLVAFGSVTGIPAPLREGVLASGAGRLEVPSKTRRDPSSQAPIRPRISGLTLKLWSVLLNPCLGRGTYPLSNKGSLHDTEGGLHTFHPS